MHSESTEPRQGQMLYLTAVVKVKVHLWRFLVSRIDRLQNIMDSSLAQVRTDKPDKKHNLLGGGNYLQLSWLPKSFCAQQIAKQLHSYCSTVKQNSRAQYEPPPSELLIYSYFNQKSKYRFLCRIIIFFQVDFYRSFQLYCLNSVSLIMKKMFIILTTAL